MIRVTVKRKRTAQWRVWGINVWKKIGRAGKFEDVTREMVVQVQMRNN